MKFINLTFNRVLMHPVASLLRTPQQDEIRYCPVCCPEKVSKMQPIVDAVRAQMIHERTRMALRARNGSEIHFEDPYGRDSRYTRWLLWKLDFWGIQTTGRESTFELEQKYGVLLTM